MLEISELVERKFVDVIELQSDEWEIETDSGWQPLLNINKTISYENWKLTTENSYIESADNHIVFDENMNEVFVKDLDKDDLIQTKTGLQKVTSCVNTKQLESMYDVTVNDDNHRFYSNDILSHNTITSSGYLLWCASFTSDLTIMIAAHKFEFSKEVMTRIKYAYESVPDFLRPGVTEYNKQSVAFDNGSRIISQTTTPTTGRGFSIGIFFIDEFSYVAPSIQKDFYTSISPTLSTGGKIIVSSTPQSDEDQFANIWHDANKVVDANGDSIPNGLGINGFKAFRALWYEHPDRDAKWEAEARAELGDTRFLREHLCQFIIDSETLINPTKLNQLKGIEPIEKQGQVRWYRKPSKGNTYIVALDPSMGTGGDDAAIQILECNTLIQVGEWVNNKTSIEKQIELLQEITIYLVGITENNESVFYSVESNTIGEASLVAIRNIGEENIPGIFLSEPVKLGQSRKFRKGFNTTNTSKLIACAKLKNLIELDKLTITSKKLVSELKTFIAVENTYKAKVGETDNLVSAMLVCTRMLTLIQNYLPDLNDNEDDIDEDIPLPFLVDFY